MKTKIRHLEKELGNKRIRVSERKYLPIWILVVVISAVILYSAISTSGFTNFGGSKISKSIDLQSAEKAGENAIAFINQNLLQGQATATLNKISDEGDVYRMEISVDGQNAEVYLTKDEKLLFLQAVDISQAPFQQQAAAPASSSPSPPQQSNIQKTNAPEVLLFTMAYCPYGNQAEDGLKPVAELLGDNVEVEPHFVIYSNYGGGGPDYCLDSESKYCSLHGIQELHEDIRELIIYRDQPDQFWNYVDSVNRACNSQNVDSCWENVAKAQGIDTERVKAASQTDAVSLLQKEVELNQKYGVRGSPTLIINGAEYSGGRSPEAYKTAVCSAFSDAPDECSQVLAGAAQASAPAAGGCH